MFGPDLTANLIHALYNLFTHNYILLAYLMGLLVSIAVAIKKPSRFALLLVLGFTVLAFSFEYDKHIAEGLRLQTLESVVAGQGHDRAEKWINLVTSELLPVFFYVGGWVLVYLAILIGGWKKKT